MYSVCPNCTCRYKLFTLHIAQVSCDVDTNSTLRRTKLAELDSCVQTLSSQTGLYEQAQSEAGTQTSQGLEQLSQNSKRTTEECEAVISQTQIELEKGIGSVEKVYNTRLYFFVFPVHMYIKLELLLCVCTNFTFKITP